ncbi:MAG: DoxX family membrane protein [Planctomycetia bacterium]|nr:DoxX family membrane protein [Planctomycetia bacterium]
MGRRKITDRKMKNGFNIIVLIARILIGGILIYVSIDKIIDPGGFARAVDNYHLIPFGLENSVAIVLPWMELIIGICLIFGIFIDGAAFLVIVIMVIFIIAITYAILSGYNIECGCGLKRGELVGIQKIIEDLIYLIVAWVILKRPNRKFELYPK